MMRIFFKAALTSVFVMVAAPIGCGLVTTPMEVDSSLRMSIEFVTAILMLLAGGVLLASGVQMATRWDKWIESLDDKIEFPN